VFNLQSPNVFNAAPSVSSPVNVCASCEQIKSGDDDKRALLNDVLLLAGVLSILVSVRRLL
jgi:hypothetical protein